MRAGKVVVLVGPTAVGKSRLAMGVAEEIGAEIVSADSRQVYRYMDVGTAKPTREEQARVRHYMLDLVEPDAVYSAQRFREEGLRVLARIGASGRPALVVGGTGFYVRALLDGPLTAPVPPNEGLRVALRAEAERYGQEHLHARLAELDPASAERIHANNLPRVIRALEIVDGLGGPVPVVARGTGVEARWIGLTMDRGRLHEIADWRIDRQMAEGLREETEMLLRMGYPADAPGLSGFGYREMVSHIEGRCDLATAVEEYRAATRRFIRRQYTWFRGEERVTWVELGDGVERVREMVRRYVG